MTYEIGTGYQKQTGWIGLDDGFLVLDRNFNQNVDNGTELLRNPQVADPAKGLRSLADWGISAIDYSNSRYEFSSTSGTSGKGCGSIYTQTPEDGVLYTPVGVATKMAPRDGAPEILIAQNHSDATRWTLKSVNETWRQAA